MPKCNYQQKSPTSYPHDYSRGLPVRSRPKFKISAKLPRLLGFIFCFFLLTNTAFASFHKNIWPKWTAHNPLSQEVISHKEWDDFLGRCVITNKEDINLIDYPHLKKADLDALKQYIARMSRVNIHNYNRDEQLAFWLNLYNALTIKIVAEYYPIESIDDVNISPGLFSIGPWGANLVTISGTPLSLDDIQNRIIRPIWNDPRTHYAINDATIGAANLSKEAFQGATIEQQLNQVAHGYINSLRGVQVIEGKLIVSKVYDWYIDDFGGNESALIKHLSVYAREPLRNQLQLISSVNSYMYNWHINSTVAVA